MRRLPQSIAALTVAVAVAATAMAQSPAPAPAASVATAPLSRYIPKDGLFVYLEIQGTEARADAWGKTAASKILNDTPTGAMLDDLTVQLLDRMNATAPAAATPGSVKLSGQESMGILRHVMKSGMAFGLRPRGDGKPTPVGTAIFRNAMKDDVSKKTFAAMIRTSTPAGGKTVKVTKPGNRSIAMINKADGTPHMAFWVENKLDLVMTDDPDGVIASLEGKAKNVADLPLYAEVFAETDGFVPLAAGWVDIDAFPAGPSQAATFFNQVDLKGVKRVDLRFGMRGEALMHELRLLAPSPRTGTLAMLDQPTFDLKNLPPLPDGVNEFSAYSIDLPKLYGQVQALASKSNPQASGAFEKAETTVKARTRLRLKEDILGRLGPMMTVYSAPKSKASGGLFGSFGGGGVQVPKGAMLIEIKDAKGVTTMIDQLMIFANKEIKTQMAALAPPADPAPGGNGRKPSAPPMPEFKVTINNPKTYVLNLPTQYAAMTNLRLTVAVGKKHLVIASMPDAAKEAMAAEGKSSEKELTAEVARAVEGLSEGLTMLTVSDPSDTLPEGLAKLPATIAQLTATAGAAAGAPPQQGGLSPSGGGNTLSPSGLGEPLSPSGGDGSAPAPAPGSPAPSGGPPGRGGRRGPPRNDGGGDGPIPASFAMAATLGQVPAGPAAGPSAGIVPIRIDPAKIPSADAIRPLLFPGASAVVVDETSIRFIGRYAFPDISSLVEGAVAARTVPAMLQNGNLPGMPAPGSAPGGPTPGGPRGGPPRNQGGSLSEQ